MYLRSVLFSLCLVIAVPASAQKVETADVAQVKEILKRSVGFRTVEGQGQVPAYAAYLASVLKEGGFADSEITITPMGETATLVARWPGTGNATPIVPLGHMDVEIGRSEEHTAELQSLMRISYAVFCLTKQLDPNKIQSHL